MKLRGSDVISIQDFERQSLEQIFDVTDRIMSMNQDERRTLCAGKSLGYLFFEPSTRTRLSFEAAMASVGGTSFGIADTTSSSSQKGESLADMIRIMAIYSDVMVLRHPLDGSSRFAAEISKKPVINGGSGTEEHPTQAIQDLYTIRKEHGKIDGLRIGIVGDLKYGRTVYSLLHALGNYDVKIYLISPESLRIRSDSVYEIRKKMELTELTNLNECVDALDVIYVTRVQRERFPDVEEYLKVRGSYVIGTDMLKKMKQGAIIMHPLPRLDEISTQVDASPAARYFEQAKYGMDTRAALLALILGAKI